MNKRTATRQDDVIWMTKELKYNGICNKVQKDIDAYFNIFVVAVFEKTLGELRQAFDENGLPYSLYKSSWDTVNFDVHASERGGKPIILLSDVVSTLREPPTALSNASRKKRAHIIVSEHYPTPEKDRDILSFAAHLPYVTTICFYVSLDEPLMKIFCGKGFATTLKNFGLDDTKPVSGPMVTAAIHNAQKKVMHMAIADEKVSSMEEWFYYNCPKTRNQMA
jgi:hypothetical protein